MVLGNLLESLFNFDIIRKCLIMHYDKFPNALQYVHVINGDDGTVN